MLLQVILRTIVGRKMPVVTLPVWCNKVFLLISLAVFLLHLCHGKNIYIDSKRGNDTNSCISENSFNVPCLSLQWAFQPPNRGNNVRYVLLDGPHKLNESIAIFEGLKNITFLGNDSTSANNYGKVLCTAENTGLAFLDVTDIKFERLIFENCSAERKSTSRNFNNESFYILDFQVGLYFYHCQNVDMHKIEVTKSPNATGVVMYDSNGVIKITDSDFTENVLSESATFPGGGGFYVEFSYCNPGDWKCNDNQKNVISHESQNSYSQYIFSNCTFMNNRANVSNQNSNATFVIPYRADHEAFGRGGGLSIFLKGNATGNRFKISDCQFESNQAVWGGGLFIELQDDTVNNSIYVSNSNFSNNSCYFTVDSGTSGGGMRIGHYVYGNLPDNDGPIPFLSSGNNITVEGCSFVNNTALNGGGLSISSSLQNYETEHISSISIIGSNFMENIAKLGAALHIDKFSLMLEGHMLKVLISGGTFHNNSVNYAKYIHTSQQPHEVGLGTVYIHGVRVTFQGDIEFFGNHGTALAAIGAPVDFSGGTSTCFEYNRGNKGGAIALLGSANIEISNTTNFSFHNNTAVVHGGGIYNQYIAKESLKSYSNCFIRHIDPFCTPQHWGAKFLFVNNVDQGGTRYNSIYTTSIWPCSFTGSIPKDKIFHWDGWNHFPYDHDHPQDNTLIASDIGNIEYNNERGASNSVEAFPGFPFELPLTVGDDYNTKMNSESVFSASINTENATIGEHDFNFTFIQGINTVLTGSPNQHVILEMDNLGDRVWHVKVVVKLVECPPGFRAKTPLNETADTFCDCSNTYGGALTCDAESRKALLRNGNWLGQLKGGNHYLSAVCPPGFCYQTSDSLADFYLPNNSANLNDLVCGQTNRNGTLCGQCREGFGPAVNSLTNECVNCTDQNIAANAAKYIASVYIPLTVLFTLLILFDIRLTTGPANAFILYCQVIASTFDLNAGGQIPLNRFLKNPERILKTYRIPYGIFNLEFVENFLSPLCLGTELNNLSVFVLDYAVAICPLVMIFIVILCVRIHIWIAPKCRRNGRHWERLASMSFSASLQPLGKMGERKSISEAVLPAFAAFLLLSYTKFTLASAYILSYRWLIDEDGQHVNPARVYFAGHFDYGSKEYLPYFLTACLIFITVVFITPLLLLDYPLRALEWILSKVNCLWRFYPVDKVHVLLDTFQGCYKIKMRFFAGLYFVFRLTICIIYLAIDTWLDQFVAQQIACIIMVMLLAICQPYNEDNKLFNYVDILIFLNLAAVNAISLYLFAYTQNYPNIAPPAAAFAFQYILVFLPLIYMICYIMWRLTQPCHSKMKNATREMMFALLRRIRPKGYTLLPQDDTHTGSSTATRGVYASRYDKDEDNDGIEDIFVRAEKINTYRPSPTSFVKDSKEDTGLHIQSGPVYVNYGGTQNSNSSDSSTNGNDTSGQLVGNRAKTD